MTVSPAMRLVVASIVAVALGAGVGLALRADPPAEAPMQPLEPRAVERGNVPDDREHPPSPSPLSVESPPAADYAILFRDSDNHRLFIIRALAAAEAGDAQAQYYIAAALGYCDETYRLYFKRRDKVLSLDEAIAVQTNRGSFQYIEAIKRADRLCREINGRPDPSWGTADEWLARAAQAGQPVALFRKAIRIWMDMETSKAPSFIKPDGTPYSLDDARAMVRSAARSAHPEVMFELGGMSLLMKPDSESEENQDSWTWMYVACLRGLDCRAGAYWHQQFCTFDPDCRADEPGMDYLRRVALQQGVYDLELRASQINERIDAGDWAALDLAD